MFDICIIGAGVIGGAIARELSKYQLNICLIEKNEDVAAGTTKSNSGIVHGGYAARHGTLKAKLSAKGNHLYRQLNDELHFGFSEVGSFVVGFSQVDKQTIKSLYKNGLKNGAQGLEIVDGDFVHQKEPHLNKDIVIALYCKTAGIVSPYEFAIALVENAIENGVTLKLNTEAIHIEKKSDYFIVQTNEESIQSRYIINAAGLYSDEVAQMVGLHNFVIKPKRGEYLLFDKEEGALVNSVIFQVPSAGTKGVLVTKTYHGNLLIGPDANYVHEKEDVGTTKEGLDYIVNLARQTLPQFDLKKVITSFSGNRATPSTSDFIIEESAIKGFINVAGIESPGLTAAPAIALYVKEILQNMKIKLTPKKDFNPYRKPYHVIADMSQEELDTLIKKDPAYGRIVCRCETVSEGEILDALSRPIPIHSIDAVKRRTRVNMGRCQGGFCTPKILEVMCQKLEKPFDSIGKKSEGSEIVMGRTKRSLVEKNDKE